MLRKAIPAGELATRIAAILGRSLDAGDELDGMLGAKAVP